MCSWKHNYTSIEPKLFKHGMSITYNFNTQIISTYKKRKSILLKFVPKLTWNIFLLAFIIQICYFMKFNLINELILNLLYFPYHLLQWRFFRFFYRFTFTVQWTSWTTDKNEWKVLYDWKDKFMLSITNYTMKKRKVLTVDEKNKKIQLRNQRKIQRNLRNLSIGDFQNTMNMICESRRSLEPN